ncbi:MAG: MBL fold metallo-hydrolase [Bacteroidota bacterium]|nr:MBL fold metallo-hydrolase [Bacteroidota bacterium]
MKVIKLKTRPNTYSGNTYLVLGSWNALNDVNTVIDSGIDDFLISQIELVNTGVGKKKVDKVFLTHTHFDHAGGVDALKRAYTPIVYAGTSSLGIDKLLKDNEIFIMGDKYFEAIKTPGHSSDSFCFYCKEERVLFSGDTNLQINSGGGVYEPEFLESLQKLAKLKISVIYPGHGDSITASTEEMIKKTIRIVKESLKQK